MILFIDGPQLCGKTTLINGLKENLNWKSFKFDFSKYANNFDINNNRDLRSFQIGKDCATLYWLHEIGYENLIIDRGIMSSIYYSLLLNRMGADEVLKLLDLVKEIDTFNEFKFIFIISKNRPKNIKRKKKDGFDELPKEYDDKILDFMIMACKIRGINFQIFINDFNKSIEENLKILLEDKI